MNKIFHQAHIAKIFVTLYDVILAGLCMYFTIKLRYLLEDKPIPSNIDETATLVFMASTACVWIFLGTYKAIWRFTSLEDLKDLLQSVTLAAILTPLILFIFFDRAQNFPRSAPFMAGLLFLLALTLSRLIIVFVKNGDIQALFRNTDTNKQTAILIGSSHSLHNYIRDMTRKQSGPEYNIIGLIETHDDNRGRSIRGHPVLGTLNDLHNLYKQHQTRGHKRPTLIATDPHLERPQSQKLIKLASELNAPLVRVNSTQPNTLTPFEASDLIGRQMKSLDINPVKRLISGKCVLITGAGGTIGSEITRQIANLSPAHIALIDASEHNLYEIERKLERDYSQSDLTWNPYLANICDFGIMRDIFSSVKPDIILHAAAYKHVHLSEINPIQTLKTNVLGTRNLLDLCREFEVESFTLVSTDKAVEPTNIMGGSKRIAELLTMSEHIRSSDVSVCTVRFGNVLASNGSVVPLFEEQIARGGPITIRHKNVERFFMTTEEAAALVLQATALNVTQRPNQSPIYVLDMGKPVSITKLARQLIRLRGLVPDRDIKIEYTQLKPGEKLSESLTCEKETLETTYVEGVHRISNMDIPIKNIRPKTDRLISAIQTRNPDDITTSLKSLLPKFEPKIRPTSLDKKVQSADNIIPLNSK